MSRERYCIAARYCYLELNERCVMRHMKSVCGCGRAFYRNPETLICERKLPLLVSLELPEHSYVQEVADKKTLEFKAYESAAQHLIWGLVKSSKILSRTVIDIEVTGFRPGLLVRSRLVVMSSLVHKLASNVSGAVHEEIQKAIAAHNSTGLFLRTANMRTVAADVAVNPCEDRDSNYCSPYAICTYRKQDYGMSCRLSPWLRGCFSRHRASSWRTLLFHMRAWSLPEQRNVQEPRLWNRVRVSYSIRLAPLAVYYPSKLDSFTSCVLLQSVRDWYIGNRCQFQMKRIIVIMVVVASGSPHGSRSHISQVLEERAPPELQQSTPAFTDALTFASRPAAQACTLPSPKSLEDGLSQVAVSVISK
ncbi:hypothetical protein MRX96_029193 [Rhipicephalus microplus]